MFNNFIGGGQVFLHKVRMLQQVFARTIHIALMLGVIFSATLHIKDLRKLDWVGFMHYHKASIIDSFNRATNEIRTGIDKKPNYMSLVNAQSKTGLNLTNIDPKRVMLSPVFIEASKSGFALLWSIAAWSCAIMIMVFVFIVLLWSRFGQNLKSEKAKDGSSKILTDREVRTILKRKNQASDFHIGKMPLVKDMETQHFLVTGSTGSGKTNLIHNLLPQIEKKKQPCLIIDQTGEMISKYYNPERGDIIFSPFDARSATWDFFTDCGSERHLEKFADVLIGFNSRKSNKGASDFWEESAMSIFVDCAVSLKESKKYSMQELYKTICVSESPELKLLLQGKNSAKYFSAANEKTAASIMSVLMTGIKPLRFLEDCNNKRNSFSIKEYLKKIDEGFSGWLFLASDASTRELTIPLMAALSELFIAGLMKPNTSKDKRIWLVMDELAAFGRFPSLPKLMQEGRKYGACVVAGLQSSSQLFAHYGQGEASNLFALFKTKFAFQSDDPMMGKLYSSICGSEIITRQQKNTSFGAHEFRDGVSYNEHQQERHLVKLDDFARLGKGECYTLLPVPEVRLSKMQTPYAELADKHEGFIEKFHAVKENEEGEGMEKKWKEKKKEHEKKGKEKKEKEKKENEKKGKKKKEEKQEEHLGQEKEEEEGKDLSL